MDFNNFMLDPKKLALLNAGVNMLAASRGGNTDLTKGGLGYGLQQGLLGAAQGYEMGNQFKKQDMRDQQRNRMMGLLSDNAPESVNGAPAVGPTKPGMLANNPLQQELARSMVSQNKLGQAASIMGIGGRNNASFQKGETNLMKDKNGNYFVQGSTFDPVSGKFTPSINPLTPGAKVDPENPPQLVGGQYGFLPEEAVRQAGNIKSEEMKQTQIRKAEEDAIKAYEGTQLQMGRYDEAVQALDSGAGTGPIESIFPTMRASTAKLEAVGNQLALGILSTVSMGALSDNELSMLKATALPTNMDEPELREWLLGRKAAEQKLADLYLEAAQNYGRGMSPTEFKTMKKKQYETQMKSGESTSLDDLVNKYAD